MTDFNGVVCAHIHNHMLSISTLHVHAHAHDRIYFTYTHTRVCMFNTPVYRYVCMSKYIYTHRILRCSMDQLLYTNSIIIYFLSMFAGKT